VKRLLEKMSQYPALKNVEAEDGLQVPEYKIEMDRDKIKRLSIAPEDIASTFRAAPSPSSRREAAP